MGSNPTVQTRIMEDYSKLKIYIAVLEDVPASMVPVIVAHAVCPASLEWQADDVFKLWWAKSFKKVVVKVNAKEFAKLQQLKHYAMRERTVLDGKDCCLVIHPKESLNPPNVLRFTKLWKP